MFPQTTGRLKVINSSINGTSWLNLPLHCILINSRPFFTEVFKLFCMLIHYYLREMTSPGHQIADCIENSLRNKYMMLI